MNKNGLLKKLITILLCMSLLTACSSRESGMGPTVAGESEGSAAAGGELASGKAESLFVSPNEVHYGEEDLDASWNAEGATAIRFSGTGAEVEGPGATVDGSRITIASSGVYIISGKLENGSLVIDSRDKGIVRLVLTGAEIHCEDSSPVYVVNAKKTIITLQEGTENVLSDGKVYKYAQEGMDEPNGTLYSKDNLTINGTGTLTVRASFNNGIVGKDELRVVSGNINVYSVDDGITGKDKLLVRGGTIRIEADGDGMKATNTADEGEGFIFIEGGKFHIVSGADAMETARSILITGGDFAISAVEDGIHADESIDIKSGAINITKSYEGIESNIIRISGGEIRVVAAFMI